MFDLIKIEYGRSNVPEPMTLPDTSGIAYKAGMALLIDGTTNKAVAATGDVTAQYICIENKTGTGSGKILCYRVLPQMIFSVPVYDYTAAVHVVGKHVKIHTDGLSLGSVAASGYSTTVSGSTYTTVNNFGAVIEDTLGAATDGDCVLVRLA